MLNVLNDIEERVGRINVPPDLRLFEAPLLCSLLSDRFWRKAAVHHDEPFLIAQRASAAGRSANIVASSVVGCRYSYPSLADRSRLMP
jgi:hypothetical protein